jgi:leucyl-tRNA synthetase
MAPHARFPSCCSLRELCLGLSSAGDLTAAIMSKPGAQAALLSWAFFLRNRTARAGPAAGGRRTVTMAERYVHRIIERKWRDRWEREGTHVVDLGAARRPFYNLMMFPYPSAEGLHVGNVFAFVGSDIQGRYRKALGYDVFEPMGFDAFGMHSENVALRSATHPRELVQRNIRRFREEQLSRIGNMFDWTHEVDTTDPAYYRWTQWIFLRLFRAGLAYRAEAEVNWCPSCKTVLADEQTEGGRCERCESEVQRRSMTQWFLRITAYAQRLLDNLDRIDWSDVTREAQRRWIGRTEGADIILNVSGMSDSVTVFTTRPETLWGATFLVLAPGNPLASRITPADRAAGLGAYRDEARRHARQHRDVGTGVKTGFFTGAYAVHPATRARLPIWISDYVRLGHGSGALMGVPAHDARDFEFAQAFNLPIVTVMRPNGEDSARQPFEGDGVLENSGPFSGVDSAAARERIGTWLAERSIGGPSVAYRLHDWCISRQRYWGPPIPVIYCDRCGTVAVPEESLPVLLPHLADYVPDGSGLSPLARDKRFLHATCPTCGSAARRETDVSDNFLDSAWYFLRYPSSQRTDVALDRGLTRQWLPVSMYVGGNEHAVLHLMYARFITMALHDQGILGFDEPFERFRAHGLIIKDGSKMSKSRGNVVLPDAYLERYGADVFRTYLMFFGDFQLGGDFRDGNISGVERFLHRVWSYVTTATLEEGQAGEADFEGVLGLLAKTIARVTQDIERLHYNTAIAAIMELLPGLMGQEKHYRLSVEVLLKLLGPFAPFLAHELWERIGGEGMLCTRPWPVLDARPRENEVEIVIQVNGRLRDRMRVPRDTPQEVVVTCAMKREAVIRHVGASAVERLVFVPDRILNIVTR